MNLPGRSWRSSAARREGLAVTFHHPMSTQGRAQSCTEYPAGVQTAVSSPKLLTLMSYHENKTNSAALVCKPTIPIERTPLVGEVSVNFCG
jgi:hypothetical protein